MAVSWKSPLLELPADGSTVWIRRLPWWATPTQATFDLATLTFTAVATAVPIPAGAIYAWRAL
jgi:hypothetical protein